MVRLTNILKAQEDRRLLIMSYKSTDAHTVLCVHLKNAMLALLFDQRSNPNVTLLPYKEKVNYYFHCFG